MWESIYEVFEQQGRMPNKFSIRVGERIKEAREEKGMSQEELARRVYRRRPSISEIENGKMYPDIETLLYLAKVLEKPLLYFIPEYFRKGLEVTEIEVEEQELIMVFRQLSEQQKKVAILQLKALIKLSNE